MAIRPSAPIARTELLHVHQPVYLDRLRKSAYVAAALELPPVKRLPHLIVDRCVLRPMRWATAGTVLAASESMQHGFAVNLGGGFHHAKPDGGEGFCIYADIALAIDALRRNELLSTNARIAYIDLDAHQGNGVCHAFRHDNSVFIFDMYNAMIYPCYDLEAQQRIDCNIRLTNACTEEEYQSALEHQLPGFLDSISHASPVEFAIYNAGTDVFQQDPLGDLNVSAAGILRRDLFAVGQLRQRGIPTLMLLSGGYTSASYQLVATSVIQLLESELAT
jgi:histone deacetylase 11